ncbi:3-deoxy-D-manno-octulosonic acid transferase [Deferribacteres bacterium DY0037]
MAFKKKEDEDYFQRYGVIKFPEPPAKCIWFHCASVGEVRSLKSAMDFINKEFPDIKIMISTTTATGKKMAMAELDPYFAFLLPIENSMSISHIIDYMNVKAVFIIDTELWPNMIRMASRKSRLFLLNGRMSDKSFRSYKRFSFLFGSLLKRFEVIFTKSDEDTEKFSRIKGSPNNIVTLGNIKFNSRAEIIDSGIFNYIKNHSVFAAASTHRGEEEIVINAFKKSKSCDRLIIAPRHINRIEDIRSLVISKGLTVSMLADRDGSTDVVIVDRFGTLEELYITSDKIFIGGSLNHTGGHNIFEALQFEKCVATGPNMRNFQEISSLASDHRVTCTVKNEDELAEFIDSPECGKNFKSFFQALDTDRERKLMHLKEVLTSVYNS